MKIMERFAAVLRRVLNAILLSLEGLAAVFVLVVFVKRGAGSEIRGSRLCPL